MTKQCKAERTTKKGGVSSIHLCGRAKHHGGVHECFCGVRWKSEPAALCDCWRAGVPTRYEQASPNRGRISAGREIALYGGRLIDMETEPNEGKEVQP